MLISVGIFVGTACGIAAGSPTQTAEKSSDPGPNPAAANSVPSASVPKPSRTVSKPADVQSLTGRDRVEVEVALGKPTGKLQSPEGALWLYAEWRVQFDQQGKVLKIEKDQPVRLAKLDPQFVAAADALERGAAARAAVDDAVVRVRAAALHPDKIRIISNGGEQVDLASLLVQDKITIVDFYAEWCGPCRRISPILERFVKSDPDIVLLKIDIVNWGTPVTRQFGVNSVPNVLVFNRAKAQVGAATHDEEQIMQRVNQAKGSILRSTDDPGPVISRAD